MLATLDQLARTVGPQSSVGVATVGKAEWRTKVHHSDGCQPSLEAKVRLTPGQTSKPRICHTHKSN